MGGYPYPPISRSLGIKDLGGGSRQVFGFKGLARKVFKNQRLSERSFAPPPHRAKSGRAGDPGPLRISAAGSPLRLRSGSRPLNASTSELPQPDLYLYRCARGALSQWISITGGSDEKSQRLSNQANKIPRWGKACQAPFFGSNLGFQKTLRWFGQRGPSPGRRAHLGPDIQVISIVDDLRLEVCDGAHGVFVMKNPRGPCNSVQQDPTIDAT